MKAWLTTTDRSTPRPESLILLVEEINRRFPWTHPQWRLNFLGEIVVEENCAMMYFAQMDEDTQYELSRLYNEYGLKEVFM